MEQDGKQREKPCADCGKSTVVESARRGGITAAGTYDLLISWGVSEDAASAAVESGVRATDAHDAKSVLAAALSASSERARVCEEAYVALEEELEELEKEYNVMAEAFEGAKTEVDLSPPGEDNWE